MALSAHLPHRRSSLSFASLRKSLSGDRSPQRLAGELALGAAGLAIGGFALYFFKERSQEEARHTVVERDGAFSLRRYARLTVAEVTRPGTLAEAMDQGFEPLFDYISAKPEARAAGADTQRIAMTVPVTVAPGDQSGSWRVRFVMPRSWNRADLPEPARDVTLGDLPPRTIAALRFSGRGTDRELVARKRAALLEKVEKRGLHALGEPEFAAYNAPIVPGTLRRNEWWVEVQAK